MKCPKCGGAIKVLGAAPPAGDDDDWLSLDDPLPQPATGGSAPGPASTGAAVGGKPPASRPPAGQPTAGQPPAAGGKPAPAGPPAGKEDWEDWFDDLPPLADAGPAHRGSASGSGGQGLSAAEEAALAAAGGYDWDQDELGSSSEFGAGGSRQGGHRKPAPLKPEQQIRDSIPTNSGGAAPSRVAAGPAAPTAPTAPNRSATGAPSEYRAKCPVCGSIIFVRPQQAGRSVRCSDCHSNFVIPPPPVAPVAKPKVDVDRFEAFQLSEAAEERDPSVAPGFKSAAEYLRAAEDAEVEEERAGEYDNPDVRGWLRGIFGIFLDPSVAAYWLMLSLLGALPGMLAVALGHPVVLIISLALLVVYGSLVVACGFSILESVAGGQRRVDEWPVFNPAEWIGHALIALAAIALSGLPGAVLGYPVFGPHLGSVALVMFSIYLLFPYVLLSMLDNGTPFMPVSGEVTKSVTRCKDAWGSLYFSSMLLFFFQFVLTAGLSLMPAVAAVFFNSVLWVGLVFVYFAMIGRLAFEIGQPINVEDEEEEP
ncbi:hypothetical protein [Candidatus Laterigemmans baculatus]|uniref:hypothetical protein n=1 Tax=Candidatus Laterigemmans baculatus TaxID=2770505 RepID=UPI0013D9CD02|nr:hypothetical protein [Candidatus Laterigemmans baculatus]